MLVNKDYHMVVTWQPSYALRCLRFDKYAPSERHVLQDKLKLSGDTQTSAWNEEVGQGREGREGKVG